MIEKIKEKIESSVEAATVYVRDPMSDGQHFEAIVIAPQFEGMLLVKQHQLVMNTLKDEFKGDVVHALQLKTFTPQKWEEVKSQYIN